MPTWKYKTKVSEKNIYDEKQCLTLKESDKFQNLDQKKTKQLKKRVNKDYEETSTEQR